MLMMEVLDYPYLPLRGQNDPASAPGENYFSKTSRFGDIQFEVVEIVLLAYLCLQNLGYRALG
jgi:hypothetical protein